MRTSARTFIVAAVSVAASLGLVTPSPAQQPIRIGASLSKIGEYAKLANPMHLSYQRCLKHTNQKGSDLVQRAPYET